MNQILRNSLLLATLALLPAAARADDTKILYKDVVRPILDAKCVHCHGPDKHKGKLRLDSLKAILEGSDGENVIPGNVVESLLTDRITLPEDDDDAMPPEDEERLTKQELEVLKFWVQSGAKGDAKIGALKPTGETAKSILVVLANPPKVKPRSKDAGKPKKIDPAKLKIAQETIAKVEKAGASLMAIAQDTPDLRFSALNVAKEFGDEGLDLLKPAADQIMWVDLARTQVSDAGVRKLAGMKNLTRLHLENTKITDKALDHLKGFAKLEYLNLYGTQVSDAGILKLASLKNLKKLFIWQTKVTEQGARKLAAAIPGIDINTGWKEPAKPVKVAANTPAKPKPTPPKTAAKPKPTPAKPTPAKPAPKPTPKKPTPKPAPDATAKAIAALGVRIDKALAEAKAASGQATKTAGEAKKIAEAARAAATEAAKAAKETKAALDELRKAAAAISAAK